MIGIFPTSYVEIIPENEVATIRLHFWKKYFAIEFKYLKLKPVNNNLFKIYLYSITFLIYLVEKVHFIFLYLLLIKPSTTLKYVELTLIKQRLTWANKLICILDQHVNCIKVPIVSFSSNFSEARRVNFQLLPQSRVTVLHHHWAEWPFRRVRPRLSSISRLKRQWSYHWSKVSYVVLD